MELSTILPHVNLNMSVNSILETICRIAGEQRISLTTEQVEAAFVSAYTKMLIDGTEEAETAPVFGTAHAYA